MAVTVGEGSDSFRDGAEHRSAADAAPVAPTSRRLWQARVRAGGAGLTAGASPVGAAGG
jgi:hypothetical protein